MYTMSSCVLKVILISLILVIACEIVLQYILYSYKCILHHSNARFHLLFECKSNDLNSSSVVEESDCFTKYLHQFMSKLRRLLQQLIVGLSAETMCGGLRVRMSIATNRPNR